MTFIMRNGNDQHVSYLFWTGLGHPMDITMISAQISEIQWNSEIQCPQSNVGSNNCHILFFSFCFFFLFFFIDQYAVNHFGCVISKLDIGYNFISLYTLCSNGVL